MAISSDNSFQVPNLKRILELHSDIDPYIKSFNQNGGYQNVDELRVIDKKIKECVKLIEDSCDALEKYVNEGGALLEQKQKAKMVKSELLRIKATHQAKLPEFRSEGQIVPIKPIPGRWISVFPKNLSH